MQKSVKAKPYTGVFLHAKAQSKNNPVFVFGTVNNW